MSLISSARRLLCASVLAAACPLSALAMAQPQPQMQAVLDELAALKPKPLPTLTAKEARKQPSPADAVKKLLKKEGKSTAPEKVGDVNNTSIDGPGGKIKIRVYRPAGNGPFPVIVYFHGGGWVIADLDTYDSSARALTNAAQSVLVSVHYRQAPEFKFPASHDDAFAAYKWVLAHANEIHGDGSRVAVVGESAGGSLAAGVSMMARDQQVQAPVYQVLIYPVANYAFDTPSYQENAMAKPLDAAMMKWFFQQELTGSSDGSDPRISLLKANLSGLPPTTIITAQIDPLRSEGEDLANKLKAAGVKVSYRNFDGVTHEFFGMGAAVDESKEAVQFAATGLQGALGK